MSEAEKDETMKDKLKDLTSSKLFWLVVGVVVGIVALGAFRYLNLKSHAVHYHANFALYVNGKRDEFKSPTYYEEVQSCGVETGNPRERVHLHDEDPYTVHVHDSAVTWSALFANLGYTLGNDLIATSSGTYIDGQDGNKLTFYLNGQNAVGIANQVIKDKDVLLIDYGTDDKATISKDYQAIPRTAQKHDETADPSTCSGSKPLTVSDRLRAAIGLN